MQKVSELLSSAAGFREIGGPSSARFLQIDELHRQLQNLNDIQVNEARSFLNNESCWTCGNVAETLKSLKRRAKMEGTMKEMIARFSDDLTNKISKPLKRYTTKEGSIHIWMLKQLSEGFSTKAKSPQPTSCFCNFFETVGTITGIDPTTYVSVRATSWPVPHTAFAGRPGEVAWTEDTMAISLTNKMQRHDRNINVRRLPIMYVDNQIEDRLSPRVLGPQVNFNAVKQWLSHCCAHHQQTCLSDTTRVAKISGFKLIECSSRKLVTLSEIAEVDKLQFIALSYVWGSKDSSDIPAGDGLPTQTPKVIDDAIAATQYMGYNYLWDRYCIPQDNPEAKHCQIRSMDIIYECATVTIIAATGDDPSCGLPGVASTRRAPQEFVDIGSGTLVLLYLDIGHQLSQTRWDARAWTYQEGLLSCRRLCFLENQVYFQCNSIRCMESIWTPWDATDSLYESSPLYMFGPSHNPLPFPEGRVGDDPEELPVLIDTYTERELSFPSDAPNAFEGILKRFASAERPVYHIWGIPIFTSRAPLITRLVAAFLWRLRFDSKVVESPTHRQRHVSYSGTMRRRLFPSWSWVDWDGRFLIKSGFKIQTGIIYNLVRHAFSALVELSMELGNGRRVLYACEHGVWFPQNENHKCAKEEGTGLGRRVHIPTHPHGKQVPTLSMLEIHPPVLRLVGYTCDAVLSNISEFSVEKGKPMHRAVEDSLKLYRHAFGNANVHTTWVWTNLARTLLYTPLMGRCGFENELEEHIQHNLCRIADGLCHPSGDLPSSPLKKEYHFRVIIVGYTRKNVEFMVLRRSEGDCQPSETYERVNVIHRQNILHPDMRIPEAMEAGLLEGWKMMETRIV